MKKAGLILFFIIALTSFTCGQEPGETRSVFTQWQKAAEEKQIPGIPAFFITKVHSNWFGIGVLVNYSENLDEESFFRDILRDMPLLQAVLIFQSRKTSSSFLFTYDHDEEKNEIWTFSARFSF